MNAFCLSNSVAATNEYVKIASSTTLCIEIIPLIVIAFGFALFAQEDLLLLTLFTLIAVNSMTTAICISLVHLLSLLR